MFVAAVLLLTLPACATSRPRPAEDSLPHFFRVDNQLYRGGQPTLEGFHRLAARGVKTIISLRAQQDHQREEERQLVESLGMQWVSLPMRMY
jgi:protein tyrosine phosphatase (PTP) superfamily phosphohydrolase (DUF442 family)